MSKILYIKANPKKDEDSYTFKASEAFIKAYKETHPDDSIETLNLYDSDIDFLRGDDLTAIPMGGSEKMRIYADQFLAADKYVIAAPMWNFGIPAILKAYIDYIIIAGVTFEYGESGPKGLVKENAKLLHITARGGNYGEPPMSTMEMGDKYLRTILSFIGIKDIETIAIEKTAMGDEREKQLATAKEKAESLAKEW